MTSKQDDGDPDHISFEGGGPAHNTTLDVHDGRLPGADQTSDKGPTLRGSGEQLPEGGSHNREAAQDIYDPAWVTEVLDKSLAVRLSLHVLHPQLTTLDKAVAECLATLSFDDKTAAAWLLQSPQLGEVHEELRRLLKTSRDEHSLDKVRHMVDVWLHDSAQWYGTMPAQPLLHNTKQNEPPAAMGLGGSSSQLAATPGFAHFDPSDPLGSSQIPHRLNETTPRQGAGSLFGPPAVAGGISYDTNFSSSNPVAIAAEGAVQRAGFCGTASTDAPQGASPAVLSTPHHVESDCSALLSAFAGGISSFNTNSSSIPASISAGLEGAATRVGFHGAALAGPSQGSSLAAGVAFSHSGADARPQLATTADEDPSYQPYTTHTPLSEVAGRPAQEPLSRDLSNSIHQAPCRSGASSHPPAPAPQAVRAVDMTPFRPVELAGLLEGAMSPSSTGRVGQDQLSTNAQLLDTAALLPVSVYRQTADFLQCPPSRAAPAKSFLGINQGLEAEPSRNLETSLESSVSASGSQNFVLARTPYQPVGHPGSGLADRMAAPPQRSRLPASGAPPRGAAPMVINAGEETRFYVYDAARTLSAGSPAIGLLHTSWVEAGLAMRVGTVDGRGLALVLAKNNTHNFLALSPSPQALLDAHGVRLPEGQLPPADPAATIKLPASQADINSLIFRLPSDGWISAVQQLVQLAAEEDADMALDEIAVQMVNLHYANSVLNGATVLYWVRKMAQDRDPSNVGQDLPPFRAALLGLVQKLRRISLNEQAKQRQPAPATSVRFAEPASGPVSSGPFYVDVDTSSIGGSGAVVSQQVDAAHPDLRTPIAFLSRRPAAEPVLSVQQSAPTLLDVVHRWQAANQPGAPLATPANLLAFTQQMQSQCSPLGLHAPSSQFGAYDLGYTGAGAAFAQSQQHAQQVGQPFGQYAPASQFGAYGQEYTGSGAAFSRSQQHTQQSEQPPSVMHFGQPDCGGFGSAPHGGAVRNLGSGAAFSRSQQHTQQSEQPPGVMHSGQPDCGGFGSAPHGGAVRNLGSEAELRQTQSAPPTPGARHGMLEVGSPTRDVAVDALLELAKASQSSFSTSFNYLVVEQRKVLMEVRCPEWYSAAPFAGFAAVQDILPHLAVLERISISEHALTFPPHGEKAFTLNLASYGMSRCDTLEKTLENVYWFSLAGTGQVTMAAATSKALAILLSACKANKEVYKRGATLHQASRMGGEAGMHRLIRLLDDELLPVSKQKATQEFKDLKAGDDDHLPAVLLNFGNVGSRCGKTEADVIEAFIDLLRKLCDGPDYSNWFCSHVTERYVDKAHTFKDTASLYTDLRNDVATKKPLREHLKERQAPARERSRMPSASANAALGDNDGMEEAIEALSNAAIESRVPPRKDPVTGRPRAVVPGPLNIPLIAKSGKLPQFNEITLRRGIAGIDCQGCKHRKGGEFKAEFSNREDYKKKHNSVPYGNNATRRILPDEVIKHDLLHCLTLWRIVWDWVDQHEEDWEFCIPVEGTELQAVTALMA